MHSYLYTSSMSTTKVQSLNKVILPIIRRAMPNIIATSIVGVSPMTGPVNQVFKMKIKYGDLDKMRITLKKEHFKMFLRLYNRRKFTTHNDILAANYPWVKLTDVITVFNTVEWCNSSFGECGYIFDNVNRFYFENKEDCAMFTLTWL